MYLSLKIIAPILLLIVVSCNPTIAPTPSRNMSPAITTPQASVQPIVEPTKEISKSVVAPRKSDFPRLSPSAGPVLPVVSSSANVVPEQSSLFSPSPSLSPLPLYSDANPVPLLGTDGIIYDDEGNPLVGAKVTAVHLSENPADKRETISDEHAAYILGVYSAFMYSVTASKPGYTKRERIVIGRTEFQPGDNTRNFGAPPNVIERRVFERKYALSNKPEVTEVTLDNREAGDLARPDIILDFSEPMDAQSVESSVFVRAFNSPKLSVDAQDSALEPSFLGGQKVGDQASIIFDMHHFQFNWNDTQNQVKLVLKKDLIFPTDRLKENLPVYELGFKKPIQDKSGIERTSHFFNLYRRFKQDYEPKSFHQFSLPLDNISPKLTDKDNRIAI